MKKRALVILLHCVAWFAFLSVPYLFKPDHKHFDKPHSEISGQHHIKSHFDDPDERQGVIQDILLPPRLANGLLFIVIFYVNYLFIIPQYQRRRNYWLLIASLVGSIILFTLLNYLMHPAGFGGRNAAFTMFGPSHNLFMLIIVIAFSFMLSFYANMRKMEQERLADEILFLKTQINPHFLFNTLNSIYSLSITRSDKTPDAIVKLSSLFRYNVTDACKNFVSLEKELKYISDYISLQKLRLSDKVDLKYVTTGDPLGYEIIPFALIPFIENAFKYGVNSQENSRIYISISIANGKLDMQVSNNKVYVEKDDAINSGLGIDNTVKRLKYMYPDHHRLDIKDGSEEFTVRLSIDLK
ncbi:MAG: hypothetical protein EOP56_10510 [Sphingobacteriales bacterium]|nr:MAG: hypothetical protein EOP56_10510 [Sphingobacteriales bacterium]